MTFWNLPPGVTDADIDRACPGFNDEPEEQQEEHDMEKVNNAFVADLAAAQSEMNNAVLNKVNPHFRSKYADFAAVREATLPALTKHGFCILQTIDVDDGGMVLKTELSHVSGERRVSCYPIPAGTAQQQGSAITYARRYSWSAITGIASEEDDDGNAATAPDKPKSAYKARKEGFYPIAEKALREQTSIEGMKAWWDEHRAEIMDLPPHWIELLQEEKDRRKLELIDEAAEDTELKQQLKGSLV